MNFYPHHIGDYLTATAHLNWVEDAAYRRLLDVYYSRETVIPLDIGQACRLVRATSKDEKQAVETVLKEFFEQTENGWLHNRCESEIAKAKGIAERARENGKRGGNPYKKQQYNEPGYLYALDLKDGSIKLGITKNYQQRLYEHRRKFKDCDYFLVVEVKDMGKCEADTLALFSAFSVGERINLPKEKWHELAAHMQILGSPAGTQNQRVGLPPNPNPNPNPITNISVSNDTGGKPPPPKDFVFSYGVALLVNAGTPEKNARAFLGGLCKTHGDSAVAEKLRECAASTPIEPLSWLVAALKPKPASKHSGFENLNYAEGINADGTFA